MKIKDLKVGDAIYIREDLEVGKRYGSAYFTEYMKQGVQRIMSIDSAEEDFNIVSKTDSFRYHYTTEMVDWEKTRILKLNESCENIKKVIRVDSIFKEITQSGESGNEITKAVTHDGREITVKNNNEENDAEKAVMLLMLKQLGITYGDVKKEVEKVKVKWVPKDGEKYYWINYRLEINWFIWEGLWADRDLFKCGNCFETREVAEGKLEKIRGILKGEE